MMPGYKTFPFDSVLDVYVLHCHRYHVKLNTIAFIRSITTTLRVLRLLGEMKIQGEHLKTTNVCNWPDLSFIVLSDMWLQAMPTTHVPGGNK